MSTPRLPNNMAGLPSGRLLWLLWPGCVGAMGSVADVGACRLIAPCLFECPDSGSKTLRFNLVPLNKSAQLTGHTYLEATAGGDSYFIDACAGPLHGVACGGYTGGMPAGVQAWCVSQSPSTPPSHVPLAARRMLSHLPFARGPPPTPRAAGKVSRPVSPLVNAL